MNSDTHDEPSDRSGADLDSWIQSLLFTEEPEDLSQASPGTGAPERDPSQESPDPAAAPEPSESASVSPTEASLGSGEAHVSAANGLSATDSGSAAGSSEPSRGNPAPAAPEAACWGAQLKTLLPEDVQREPCDYAFVPGKNHLKNKFCASCQLGLLVPASHVRALTPALAPTFANGQGSGIWTSVTLDGSTCNYRVVNQTRACRGAPLAIFAQPPPDALAIDWGEIPREWFSSTRPDLIPLAFALGTLEPSSSIVQANGAQRRNRVKTARTGEAQAELLTGLDGAQALEAENAKRLCLSQATARWDEGKQRMVGTVGGGFGRSDVVGSNSSGRSLAAVGGGSNGGSSNSGGSNSGRSSGGGGDGGASSIGGSSTSGGVEARGWAVPLTAQRGMIVPPASYGAIPSSFQRYGNLLRSFMPYGLGFHPPLPSPSLTGPPPRPPPGPPPPPPPPSAPSPPITEDERTAAATENTSLLPLVPKSLPDHLGAYARLADAADDPTLPVGLHPLTLRFSPPTAEAAWRLAHARDMQGFTKYALLVFVVPYFAMGLAQSNEGARLWLLAWSIGYLPASLLAIWWDGCAPDNDKDGRPSGSRGPGRVVPALPPHNVPRLLDWGVLSLCVLPQLIVTVRTRLFDWCGGNGGGSDDSSGTGASCLIDPLDLTGAGSPGTFGQVMANWWFAHLIMRLNCTDPAITLLAVALSAALASFQAPITVVPHRELLMVCKAFIGAQLCGYTIEKAMRRRYLTMQQTLGAQRAEGNCNGAAAARSEKPATRVAATGTATVAATVASPSANRRWAAHETRMHPLTLRFGSTALEAQYRNYLFNTTTKSFVESIAVNDAAFQLVDVVFGQLKLLDACILVVSHSAPAIGRDIVHRRGDRPEEVERFRYAHFAYYLLLLFLKVFWPSAVGLGGEGPSSSVVESVAQCVVVVPMFLRLQGPGTPLCWMLNVACLAFSYASPPIISDEFSGAGALQEAAVSSEVLGYALDWGLRAQFLRATTRKDQERPV